MESLQASSSFEGVEKERGAERKGELALFLHPSRFHCHLVHFLGLALFVAQDEELTHRLQSGWAPSQVKRLAPYPRLMIYPHHSSLDTD